MAKINVYQRELYHHGILGQKWGRRQGPPYPLDASDHSSEEKKEGWRKSLGSGRNESLYERGHKRAQKDKSDFSRYKKYGTKEEEKLRKKQSKLDQKKQQVSEYEKAFDKASELSDRSDEKFREAKEQYKSLAKTPFGRIKEVHKAQIGKGSDAAKLYIKTWDEAERLGNEAADAWKESDEKYAKIGKTYASRVINTANGQNKIEVPKPKKLNKEWFDKHTGTMVIDKKTGDHISVDKETLRKKGKNEAIRQARDPEFIRKYRKEEAKLFDKTFDYYLKATNGNKEEAYKQAVINWSENTGLTKKSTEEFIKKYSSISIP